MRQNILLTPEIKSAMPDTVKITHNFGEIQVRFASLDDETDNYKAMYLTGDNAVVEGDTQEFINWLKPFDGVAIGVGGSPQFEQFEIRHIKEEL
jgi:hypothetical protein